MAHPEFETLDHLISYRFSRLNLLPTLTIAQEIDVQTSEHMHRDATGKLINVWREANRLVWTLDFKVKPSQLELFDLFWHQGTFYLYPDADVPLDVHRVVWLTDEFRPQLLPGGDYRIQMELIQTQPRTKSLLEFPILVWYDAIGGSFYQDTALTIPVQFDGDPIKGAKDLTINGHNATEATNGPTYKIVNDVKKVDFDGINDQLQITGAGNEIIASGTGSTICAVIEFEDDNTNQSVFQHRFDDGQKFALNLAGFTNILEWYYTEPAGEIYERLLSFSPNDVDLITLHHENVNIGDQRMYRNGVLATPVTTPGSLAMSANTFALGHANATNRFGGAIREFAIFSRLSDNQLEQVHDCLLTKHNLG